MMVSGVVGIHWVINCITTSTSLFCYLVFSPFSSIFPLPLSYILCDKNRYLRSGGEVRVMSKLTQILPTIFSDSEIW